MLERPQKRLIQVLADAALLVLSFVIAMGLRLEGMAFIAKEGAWLGIAAVVPVSLAIFVRLGFYRAVIRYMTSQALATILSGVLASALALHLIAWIAELPIPGSVPAIYALLAFCTVGGVRFGMRALFQRGQTRWKTPVIIFGAGAAGRQLMSSLRQGPDYLPVAFLDDAPHLHGTEIGGLRVHPAAAAGRLVTRHGAALVLLATPSATHAQRKAIVERLEPLPARVQTVPAMSDIVSGRARINELHEVAIEDLLGRDPVPPHAELMDGNIRDKVVMVTGAGGSIGAELCRQILRRGPARLVLLEIAEPALYTLDMELRRIAGEEGLEVPLTPLVGSVQNPGRMEVALKRFGVQTVYHAAAYKHVPLVEQNIVEGLRNNLFGTRIVAETAIDAGVEAVILVSTDKAVRPTNVLGASKRMAELVCQAAGARQAGTVFSMVRFGNALGSSGSVIPRFRAQIAAGGPVTVTHPDVRRYFMTIQEAAQLVIQAGAMARGGDVFILEMGEPLRILDLAERCVRLSGLTPYRADGDGRRDGDIAITFTGLRPGEKLCEELFLGEAARPTRHPRIMTATEAHLPPAELEDILEALDAACDAQDIARIRALLKAAPIDYSPSGETTDLLWPGPREAPAPEAPAPQLGAGALATLRRR